MVGPVRISQYDPPRINLARIYRRGELRIRAGQKLHISIGFTASSQCTIQWRHNDQTLHAHVKGTVNFYYDINVTSIYDRIDCIRNSNSNSLWHLNSLPLCLAHSTNDNSVVFVPKTTLLDGGVYKFTVFDNGHETSAQVNVLILDYPLPPSNLLVSEHTATSAVLTWAPPASAEGVTYQVEKRDTKSNNWYIVYDRVRHCTCAVSNLVTGVAYHFRIKSINEVGLSHQGLETHQPLTMPKSEYKSPLVLRRNYPIEETFSLKESKPEFTTPLNNRTLVIGYNGTLTCALRGHPRPKITWYKDSIPIQDGLKFRMSWGQGIVQEWEATQKPRKWRI